jgi:hypothetical protein
VAPGLRLKLRRPTALDAAKVKAANAQQVHALFEGQATYEEIGLTDEGVGRELPKVTEMMGVSLYNSGRLFGLLLIEDWTVERPDGTKVEVDDEDFPASLNEVLNAQVDGAKVFERILEVVGGDDQFRVSEGNVSAPERNGRSARARTTAEAAG